MCRKIESETSLCSLISLSFFPLNTLYGTVRVTGYRLTARYILDLGRIAYPHWYSLLLTTRYLLNLPLNLAVPVAARR